MSCDCWEGNDEGRPHGTCNRFVLFWGQAQVLSLPAQVLGERGGCWLSLHGTESISPDQQEDWEAPNHQESEAWSKSAVMEPNPARTSPTGEASKADGGGTQAREGLSREGLWGEPAWPALGFLLYGRESPSRSSDCLAPCHVVCCSFQPCLYTPRGTLLSVP